MSTFARQMTNDGYVFTFAQANSASQPVGDPPLRRRFAVIKAVEIQLAKSVVFFRIDAGTIQKIER